jgi:ABC-2 type transport system permease protein
MKGFSEEKKQGTMELLLTKPIGLWNLVWGKFLGALILVIIALMPSVLYVFTVYQLGDPVGNFDAGATMGSYFGLLLLASCYSAIGLFASSLSQSQVTAFIIAVFLCFIAFFAFEELAGHDLFKGSAYGMEILGISYHYKSMSRGVLDTRDLIYFLSLVFLFLTLTYFKIASNKNKT